MGRDAATLWIRWGAGHLAMSVRSAAPWILAGGTVAVNLADIFRHWGRWQPSALAIRFGERDLSWQQLDRGTDALAAGLAQRGLGEGDRIGILLGNCPEYIETCIAAWKLGAVVVPLNVRYAPPEAAYVIDDAGCSLLLTDAALASTLADVAGRLPVLNVSDARAMADGQGDVPPLDLAAGHPATICYTSGTTGDPKGAVLTHGSWNAASQGWAQAIALTVEDRVLLPFPLAFTGGFAVFLFTLWSGGRLVLEPSFDAGRTLELFEKERITALLGVPQILAVLVQHPRWQQVDLSSWRIACSGGASVPESLIRAIQARGVPMLQSYSLTEASAAATILPGHDALTKVGSAGLPIIHGGSAVIREDGTFCEPGEVGEILISGPQLMAGYWNNPDASAAALQNGWLHTGDMGVLDEDGYLKVVDRAKDMLISGGLNVYPAEIERLLTGLDGIIEVAVIGVPHQRWGETPMVIANTGGKALTAEQVLAACRGKLADYKMQRYLLLRDKALPRGMSGKILKRELRDEYATLPDSIIRLDMNMDKNKEPKDA